MALIGEQIRKQMELTAALMSDPAILRTEPSVVASSFAATLKKIDMLQVYLRPRPDAPAPRCDASIINDGIKQLVHLAMEKQMQPLKEPLPGVVQTDFRHAYDSTYSPEVDNPLENFAAREIRETNCMAGMVLAQYYVQWHLLLMNINQLEAPYRDENMDKDIEALQTMPSTLDLLEYRPLKGYFERLTTPAQIKAAWEKLVAHNVTLNMMTNPEVANDDRPHLSRKARAVQLYQLALTNAPSTTALVQTEIRLTLNEFHQTMAMLTGGVLTTLQLQDETQIWKDMQTLTNVVSIDHNSNQTRYSYVLQTILSNLPYFESADEFEEKGTPLCIYNYNSTPLMADVCLSLLSIRALNSELLTASPNDHTLSGKLSNALFNGCAQTTPVDTGILDSFRQHNKAQPPVNNFESFVSETANHARTRNGCLEHRKYFTVDDIAGYYISKGGLTNMERSNHVYLAHPTIINVPVGQTGFVTRMQKLTENADVNNANSFDSISYCTRNSLFTIYCIRSAATLIDRVKDHPVFRAATGKFDSGTVKLDRATLVKRINDEQKAFKDVWERLAKSGQGRYPKYAGISWPVKFITTVTHGVEGASTTRSQQNTNTDKFTNEGYIPRTVKGTNIELVQGVVDIADGVNLMKIGLAKAGGRETASFFRAYNVGGTPITDLSSELQGDIPFPGSASQSRSA